VTSYFFNWQIEKYLLVTLIADKYILQKWKGHFNSAFSIQILRRKIWFQFLFFIFFCNTTVRLHLRQCWSSGIILSRTLDPTELTLIPNSGSGSRIVKYRKSKQSFKTALRTLMDFGAKKIEIYCFLKIMLWLENIKPFCFNI
jgi:hypothetical protein